MAHDEIAIAKLLRRRGLRVTDQRLVVLDALCDAGGHTTLPEVLARVRAADAAIDQSTVHRTIELLCRLGVVTATTVGLTETVYELAGDAPHHHVRCTVCGKADAVGAELLQPAFDRIRDERAFEVRAQHLVLEGVCAACSGKEQ